MTALFADTSFYIAAPNPRDTLYAKAVSMAHDFRGQMMTTEFVLIEVGNWLSRSGDRGVFLQIMARVAADANTVVVAATHSLFERGLGLYARRPDKNWSLTDCISFVVMHEHGIRDALTADHHFEQAGFGVLLK